jgi:hypothetical protein
MSKKIIWFVLFIFFSIPNLKNSDASNLPSEPCSKNWAQGEIAAFHFDPKLDSNYQAFEGRLRSRNFHREKCLKPWTILVSMTVTPDLEKFALSNLLQLESQMEGAQVKADIIVQIEEKPSGVVRRLHLFPRKTPAPSVTIPEELKLLEFGQIQSPVISQFTAIPLIPPHKRLGSFIRWAVTTYPSENLILIFWGHGQGWKTLSDFNLRTNLAKLRWLRQKPLDILAWDACYMQSLEDIVEVADWTRFVCGSEDIESYAGYDYKNLVRLITQPDPPPSSQINRPSHDDLALQVAKSIPAIYQASFDLTSGSQGKMDPGMAQNLTGSAIHSQIVSQKLVSTIDQLALAFQEFTSIPKNWETVKSILEAKATYHGGTRDFGIFLLDVKEEIQKKDLTKTSQGDLLKNTIEKTCAVLNEAVIRKALGNHYLTPSPPEICGPSGVSIFLPQTSSEFREKRKLISHATLYNALTLFRFQSSWAKWVASMY